MGKALLWLLAALLGVSLCCILLLGTAALLVDTNRDYPTDSPFYRMLLYTAIAINGLLFHYKPTNAVVTVDGETHTYHHVWLAPTMNGRYYGGGMMPTPAQRRLNPDGTISTMVMYGKGKLKTLTVFPSIFKGEHIRHNEMVEVLTGHHIRVEFDRPTPLQIDGETIPNVTSYEVSSHGSCAAGQGLSLHAQFFL